MRPEPNNEIDLLLRQLSRQNGIPVSESDAQHLDADELNSYVANALPAKTRARYTHHLADCSSCRNMVAQLSAAEGTAVVRQPAAVVGPSGFKSFLASFFSPMVLRYAVPALGVILITVAGIVMFRQDQYERQTSVAQVAKTDENRAAPEPSRGLAAPASTPNPEQPEDAARAEEAKRSDVTAPAPVTTTADTSAANAPPPPKAAPAEEAERQPQPERKAASDAEKDAVARDGKQPDTAKTDDAVKKEKQQEIATAAPASVTTPANRAPEPQRAKLGEAAGAGARVEDAQKSRDFNRARDEGRGNFSIAETRSVAGRQFRKDRDVWIDVAYSAYQPTTIVKRGTEQYRGLIADEPEIHTIAETLKSEFVVVWKGRAYRVR